MSPRITTLIAAAALLPACTMDPESDQDTPEEVVAEETAEAQQPLFGSNACKNTELLVNNLRERNGVGTAIWIKKLKYYSADDASWHTENVPDVVLSFEQGVTYNNRDLEYVDGELITKWRIYYHYADNGAWSDLVYQTDNTPDQVCHDDDDFEMYVE